MRGGGCGSRQRQIANGADVVFTDAHCELVYMSFYFGLLLLEPCNRLGFSDVVVMRVYNDLPLQLLNCCPYFCRLFNQMILTAHPTLSLYTVVI